MKYIRCIYTYLYTHTSYWCIFGSAAMAEGTNLLTKRARLQARGRSLWPDGSSEEWFERVWVWGYVLWCEICVGWLFCVRCSQERLGLDPNAVRGDLFTRKSLTQSVLRKVARQEPMQNRIHNRTEKNIQQETGQTERNDPTPDKDNTETQ